MTEFEKQVTVKDINSEGTCQCSNNGGWCKSQAKHQIEFTVLGSEVGYFLCSECLEKLPKVNSTDLGRWFLLNDRLAGMKHTIEEAQKSCERIEGELVRITEKYISSNKGEK